MPGHCHCLAHHSFSHPPPLHLSFLRCLQITCLCKECLCLHKDRPTGASPAHLPSRLPPPWPGLLSSLAFRHGHRTLLGAAPPTSLLADLHSQATLRLYRKCRGSCYAVAKLLPLGRAHLPTAAAPLLALLPSCLWCTLAPQTLALLWAPLYPLLLGSLAGWGALHEASSLGREAPWSRLALRAVGSTVWGAACKPTSLGCCPCKL